MQNGDWGRDVPRAKSQPDNYTTTLGDEAGGGIDRGIDQTVDEVQLAEDLLRSWLLTYTVNAVGESAPLRSLELAHGALATLSAAARGDR